MDGKKIFFIIVLVLIALVFIGGTVLGATRSSGGGSGGGAGLDPTQIAKQLGGLQEGLAKPPAVAPKDVRVSLAGSTSADCVKLQDILIAPLNQTCIFTILPVDQSFLSIGPATRRLALTLSEGEGAHLIWQGQVKQDNGNLVKIKVEKDLLPGEGFKQDVYQPGGALTVSCQPLATFGGQNSSSSSLCRLPMGK